MIWRHISSSLIGKIIALSVVLSVVAPSMCSFSVSAKEIADADELLIRNQFKAAEDAYRELIDTDETGDAYAGLAVSLAKQALPSKIIEAEKVLRQAKDKFADNPNVSAAGGYVCYVHSKTVASPAKREQYLDASENLCKRALKDNPDILIAQQTLGMVKLSQDDLDGAIKPFRKSVEVAENAVNLTLLAQVLLKQDPKDKEAEDLVNRALSLKGDYAPARLQKAIVLLNQDKAEDAFLELKSITDPSKIPDMASSYQQVLGDVYKRQGDGPAALNCWKEAANKDPHNPDAYRRLAEYHTMRGDGELAISEMHDALEILPNDMPLRNQLAELALRLDKLDVAESEYRTILATEPDDPNALLGLSRVYLRKARKDGQYPSDWQELLTKLNNVVTDTTATQTVSGGLFKGKQDLNENIQLNEAEKALAQKQFRTARKIFSAVIDTHKDEPAQLLTLGEQAYNDGDLKSAEQAFNVAKEIPEVAPRAEQGISKIASQRSEAARQTKLGDATLTLPDVAADYYKQALIADPQYPPAYFGLFNLYSHGSKPDIAKAIDSGTCFLEAADDGNEQRREVESGISKLQSRTKKEGPKKESPKKESSKKESSKKKGK